MQYDDTLIFGTQLDPDGAENGLKKLDVFTANFAANITSQITSQISSALAQIPAQVMDIGKQFESSMSQVAATMGISQVSEEFELLSQTAKEMGESTKFSASQAGDALNYLALAGYDANQACAALPTVLDLAAAGGIDLARASDMVTDSMSALGLTMDELDGFVDQMAVTSQKSNTSVEQLGSAILSAGANARILAGGTNELMTELGILADSGLKSAEAGTALNRVIKNLSTPTSAARKELESLGVQAYDSSGQFRNMQDIFQDLEQAMDGFTDQQKQEALNNIFDTAALSSAKVLLSQCGERFDELSGYIDNAEGAAAGMADTMSDNLAGDLTTCQSAAEGLANTLYEEFSGTARIGVQAVTDALGVLNDAVKDEDLENSVKKLGYAFSDTLASAVETVAEDVIPAVVSGFDLIVEHGDDIIEIAKGIAIVFAGWKIASIVDTLTVSLAAATAATTALSVAEGGASVTLLAVRGELTAAQIAAALYTGDITLATAAQAAFNLVCDANPILLVTAAVAGLVTGIGLFINALNDGEEELTEYTRELDKAKSKEDDLVKSSEEDIAVIKRKTDRYEELRKKYDRLNENEMKEFIALGDELKELIPEEITLIEDQAGAYLNLADSIDKVIEKRRMDALYSAKSETYKTAVGQKEDIQNKIHTAKVAWGTDEGVGALSTWKGIAGSDNILDAENAFLNQYFLDEYGMTYDAALKALGDADKAITEFENWERTVYYAPSDKDKTDDKTGGSAVGYNSSKDEADRQAHEEEAAKIRTQDKAAWKKTRAEQRKQEQEDAEFEEAWQTAQDERKEGKIASDAELYQRLLTLYKQYGDDDRREHSKYRIDLKNLEDGITKDEKDAAEKRAAAAEKQRREQEEQRKKDEEAAKQAPLDSLTEAFDDADWEYEQSDKSIEAMEKRNKAKETAWKKYGDKERRDMRSFQREMLNDKNEYNDALAKADEDAAGELAQAREKEWTDIDKLEESGLFSSEEILRMRKDWIAKYCSEYSDEWYDYYNTVYQMEVDAAEDALAARKAYLNDELSAVKENLNVILSEYNSKYGEIQNNISSYKSKLLNAAGSTFSIEETENPDGTKTKTYRVANIKAQIDAMKKLHETLSKMKADGASASLIQEILNMSPEDGLQMAEYLINSGDLASVNELYKQRDEEAQSMAEEFYSEDVKELNADTAADIIAAYDGLPEEMQEIGAQAMDSLLDGLASGAVDISAFLASEIGDFSGNSSDYINGLTAEKPEYFDKSAVPDKNGTLSGILDTLGIKLPSADQIIDTLGLKNIPGVNGVLDLLGIGNAKDKGRNDGEDYAAGFAEGSGDISADVKTDTENDIADEVKTDVADEVKADVSEKSDNTAAESSFIAEFKAAMSEGFDRISAEFSKVVESVKDIQVHSTHTNKLLLDGKKVAESVNDYNEKLGRIADI